jgi:hypothetical protein
MVTDGSAIPGVTMTAALGPAPVSGSAPYTLSFYAKGSATLKVNIASALANVAFASNSSIVLTSSWTRYTLTGTCPASQTHLYAGFIAQNQTTTFWISAIQIEQASTASAYIDTTPAIAMPATGSQLLAQAWPGQAGDPLAVENSSGGSLFSVDANGNAVAASSTSTPVIIRPRAAQTLAVNGAVTISAASGDAVITLAANATSSSVTNPVADQILRITWVQDVTGSRTYSWPANCVFAGNTAPSDPLTASTQTTVTFRYDPAAGDWYELDRAVSVG